MFARTPLVPVLLLLFVGSAGVSQAADAKRLLVIGHGPDGHGPTTHEMLADAHLLAALVRQVSPVEVTVVDGTEPFASGPARIDAADGVVLLVSQGSRWMQSDEERFAAIARLMNRGGGLSAIHWSVGSHDGEYIAGQLELLGGTRGGPHRKYAILDTDVTPAAPEHPILRGIGPFRVHDEFYYALDLVPPEGGNTTLLTARIENRDEPCAWAWRRPEGGRAFGFVGLHFHAHWKRPDFRRLLAQGVLWTLDVPIPERGANVDPAGPTACNEPHSFITPRDGLHNAHIRFDVEKRGRVAFLGGSITFMNGWRDQVCQSLRRRFPETQFDFVNAAIPSTDTTMGAHRLARDVFAGGPVDLLFVEFAVNDRYNERTRKARLRGAEGILRQVRRDHGETDVVMLFCVDPLKMEDIRRGKVPPVVADHRRVARHYDVTTIDWAREVTARIDAGQFDWKTFGGLHPAPAGHAIYTASIDRLFDLAFSVPLPADASVRPHRLPAEPIDPLNYSHGRYVGIDRAEIVDLWQHDPAWKAKAGGVRPGFVNVPMLTTEKPGATLRLKFQGTSVGLLVVAGPDVGVLEFQIDDRPLRKLDQFTQWSAGLNIPWAYTLDDELSPGEHTLTLHTTDAKHEKSQGHACRIVQFLVNGESVAAKDARNAQ